jgi:NhaP-type Na+/H+ and K+/H+ antiporter
MSPLTKSLVASALTLVFAVGLAVTLARFVFELPTWATLVVAGLAAIAVVSGAAAAVWSLRAKGKDREPSA